MLEAIPWYVFAMISAVFVGVKVVIQKIELKKEHSLDYVVAASIVILIISLFLWPWVDFRGLDWMTIAYIYAASVFGSLAIWLGAKALRHLDVSVVSPQSVITIVFTLLFAYLFLGEVLTSGQWIGVVVLVLGGIVLARGSFTSAHAFGMPAFVPIGKNFLRNKTAVLYELLLLSSLLFFGVSSLFDKIILGRTDTVTFIFIVGIFLFINHMVLYMVMAGDIRKIPANVDKLGGFIVVIAVLTILARLTYAQALSMEELSLVIPIKKSSILISTIWGGQLFKEKHFYFRAAAAVVMLVGVWLLVR